MSDVKGMYIGGSPTYFKDETAREFISDIYDETKTYAVDSYCIHENKLYKCTTETTGGFDGSCWKETNMSTEMVDHTTAIDELNKNFEWKLAGSVIGTNSLKLPSDFSELFVLVDPKGAHKQILRPIRNILSSSLVNYTIGFAGANNQFIKLGVSLTEVKLSEVSYGNNDKTSESTVSVYYR